MKLSCKNSIESHCKDRLDNTSLMDESTTNLRIGMLQKIIEGQAMLSVAQLLVVHSDAK